MPKQSKVDDFVSHTGPPSLATAKLYIKVFQ